MVISSERPSFWPSSTLVLPFIKRNSQGFMATVAARGGLPYHEHKHTDRLYQHTAIKRCRSFCIQPEQHSCLVYRREGVSGELRHRHYRPSATSHYVITRSHHYNVHSLHLLLLQCWQYLHAPNSQGFLIPFSKCFWANN